MPKIHNLVLKVLILFSVFACDVHAATKNTVGVVLLHGKWGNPSQHINTLATSLKEKGYIVLTPLMPWSKLRGYDIDYPAALGIVENNIQELQKKGAKFIVLAGHSMGANAAIAYAAYGHEKINAVIAIAPGHTPDLHKYHMNVESSLNKANEMIKAGQGGESESFIDLNGGRYVSINMTAAAYCSYNDPGGMASMPISASKVTQRIPLFWIVAGTEDVLYNAGKEYVFEKWPSNPLNTYLILNTTHLSAPDNAKDEIPKWIDTLTLSF